MIAEKIIKNMFTTEPVEYLGECNSKSEIYRIADGLFVEGVDNETYIRYIKENSLVKLMSDYWDQVIHDQAVLLEKEQAKNKKQKLKHV